MTGACIFMNFPLIIRILNLLGMSVIALEMRSFYNTENKVYFGSVVYLNF